MGECGRDSAPLDCDSFRQGLRCVPMGHALLLCCACKDVQAQLAVRYFVCMCRWHGQLLVWMPLVVGHRKPEDAGARGE